MTDKRTGKTDIQTWGKLVKMNTISKLAKIMLIVQKNTLTLAWESSQDIQELRHWAYICAVIRIGPYTKHMNKWLTIAVQINIRELRHWEPKFAYHQNESKSEIKHQITQNNIPKKSHRSNKINKLWQTNGQKSGTNGPGKKLVKTNLISKLTNFMFIVQKNHHFKLAW